MSTKWLPEFVTWFSYDSFQTPHMESKIHLITHIHGNLTSALPLGGLQFEDDLLNWLHTSVDFLVVKYAETTAHIQPHGMPEEIWTKLCPTLCIRFSFTAQTVLRQFVVGTSCSRCWQHWDQCSLCLMLYLLIWYWRRPSLEGTTCCMIFLPKHASILLSN